MSYNDRPEAIRRRHAKAMREDALAAAVEAINQGKSPDDLVERGDIIIPPDPNSPGFRETAVKHFEKKHKSVAESIRSLVPSFDDTVSTVKELLKDPDPRIRLDAAKINMGIYKEYFRLVAAFHMKTEQQDTNVKIHIDTGGVKINGEDLYGPRGGGPRAYRRKKILDVQPETKPEPPAPQAPTAPETASKSGTDPESEQAQPDSWQT